ncbi:MAG: hypothetical protein HY532_09325 [Chloroflexi bacterium]|nr:hypothetical protein [Chloroflexota bacterium]
MKRHWLLTGLLIGALALVITAGTVMAQESDTEDSSPVKSFAARVAEKLGLTETEVQGAMKEAVTEMHDEMLKARLDKAVEAGRITQAQADEIYGWYQARPEILGPGIGPVFGPMGFHRHHGPRMGQWFGYGVPPAETATSTTATGTSI